MDLDSPTNFQRGSDTMKTYNIAFLGDAGVGKTSVIKALKGIWYPSMPYVATMGTEVHPMSLMVDGEKVIVNLWDVSGSHPSPPEGSWRTKGIHATCVFYDSTNSKSFYRAMEGWMPHARGLAIPVGTKVDLPDHKPQLLEFARLRTMKEPYGITTSDPIGIELMLNEIVMRLKH